MKSTLWASPMSPVLLLKCRISVEHVPDDAPPCTVLKVLARAKAQAKVTALRPLSAPQLRDPVLVSGVLRVSPAAALALQATRAARVLPPSLPL